ncbi:MAG: glycosyltransferase family 2 protein, partial [Pirellulaceae bacterium]|nr:glycosyltransferase family 2 protein [Pirellulaceae bacterium]
MRSNLPLFRKLPTAGKKPSAGEQSAITPTQDDQAANKPGNTTKSAAKKKKKSGPPETEQPRQASVLSVPTAPLVSVLIPARDEEASIGECLTSILACSWSNLEVIVMDDGSSDRTAAICESMAQSDSRVKLMTGRELPMGWNGKQRACWLMALAAQGQWLLFLDADVRLTPDAIPRLIAQAEGEGIDLLSGFPKQVTGTWLEKLMIPLMHFILLGYLPLARMRDSTGAEFAAGCGQLFLARRTAYMTCEGHKSISSSRHDGVKLPRSFRKQRFITDIFDASDIATCRMYHNAQQVLRGLLKNASEGIGSPRTIIIFTILLGG